MRFRRRDSGQSLEAELLASRSQPSETFVKALGAQVNATTRRSRLNTYARVAFACAISVVMFGVLASFGGIGYAASSTVDVVKAAKRVVAPAQPKSPSVVKGSPAFDQYEDKKVTICHRTGSGSVTITISRSALPAHLKHGDTIGPCPSSRVTICHQARSSREDDEDLPLEAPHASRPRRHGRAVQEERVTRG